MASINFSDSKIIYIQIMDNIKKKIMTGEWESGKKISSVRELAAEYGVNPNTMQRSLSELERELFLCSERTTGRYVTKDKKLIKEQKKIYVENIISKFLNDLREFGYNSEELMKIIHSLIPQIDDSSGQPKR